jgi:FkbM family methyltransferase
MVARYADGRRFRVPENDLMYSQVFIYGAYEPPESAMIAGLLRPGDFAIDVGANHGWFALLMGARVGPSGRVWAFEPVPPMLDELRANLELNSGLPVDVKPLALGEERGEVKLHLFSGLVHGHASTSTLGRDDYVEYAAELHRLDDLVAGEEAPALVKVDVEGAELGVLRGALPLLEADDPPIWMLEVNDETSRAFGYRPHELLEPFEATGHYATYRVGDGGLEPERQPDAAPHGTTWLCVPDARAERVSALSASG